MQNLIDVHSSPDSSLGQLHMEESEEIARCNDCYSTWSGGDTDDLV